MMTKTAVPPFGRVLVVIALALTCSSSSAAESKVRWRDIVLKKLPKDVSAVALQYTILLVENGRERPVKPETHKFAIGDQFLVRIEAQDDMYVYVFTEGPKGQKTCLQPIDDQRPLFLKKGENIDLPGDGFFEFEPPPGEEKFIVVATTEPSKDLAVLASVVFRKPDQELNAAQQKQKNEVLKELNATLESQGQDKLKGARSRGLLSPATVDDFVKDLKSKKRGTIEEPPRGDETSTFAMGVSKIEFGKPQLLINISLKSANTPGSKTP